MQKAVSVGAALAMAVPVTAQSKQAGQPQSAQPQTGATASEFAAFDADLSGKLDESEFTSWYRAKAEQQLSEAGQAASDEELSGQISQAFAQADTNKDKVVTEQELTRFLRG